MKCQKSLFVSSFALALLLGVGVSAQAKEWEQSLVVNFRKPGDLYDKTPKWGFSKDSLVEVDGYATDFSVWEISQYCICDVGFASCNNQLNHFNFFEYDQNCWKVVSVDGLKAGTALDLNDTAVFKMADDRDGTVLHDSYVFDEKDNSKIDTNYFVYQKDSTYYALCQYITVYDSSKSWKYESVIGLPAFFVHQCIFQDDGTPTFSKIPMYTGELPQGEPVKPPSVIAKSMHKKVEPNVDRKPYLVNGQSAKKNSASGIRVKKERVYRQ